MPNQQKYRPVSFRPPEADRLWLAAYAEQTGRPVNAILAEALARYRQQVTSPVGESAAPSITQADIDAAVQRALDGQRAARKAKKAKKDKADEEVGHQVDQVFAKYKSASTESDIERRVRESIAEALHKALKEHERL